MGRPLKKLNKDGLKYIMENSGKVSAVEMGRKLGVHHTTILYYQKKLKKAGIKIRKFLSQSVVDLLIKELKEELKKEL